LNREAALDLGVNFLFQELALISNSANILARKEVAYLYHKTMPLFKNMLDGKYTTKVNSNVGFVTVL